MKILVLNGSPKKEQSDTMHITRAFVAGMQEAAPQDIEIVHIAEKHIEFCVGCFTCKRNGGTCIHKDDMKALLAKVLACDLLLLNFPLYGYGMPAKLKAFIERTMPLSCMKMKRVGERYEHIGQADFAHLRYLMICGCGFPNSKGNFEPAVEQFKLLFPRQHTILTVPESPMFNVPQADSVTKPRLELVRMAGRQYAEQGTIAGDLLAQIGSPMIPEEQYAAIANGEA